MTAADITKLEAIYLNADRGLLDQVGEIISGNAESTANVFYAELLANQEARSFLSPQSVANHLKSSLIRWLHQLVFPHDVQDVRAFIERQHEIGRVHARINVPLHLIMEGMRAIRQQINQQIRDSSIDRNELGPALIWVAEVLDHCMFVMNSTYVEDAVMEKRDIFALRMELSGHMLAMQCERLRYLLLRWLADVLVILHQDRVIADTDIRYLRRADFGLWIVHGGELFFSSSLDAARLQEQVEQIDQTLYKAITCHGHKRTGLALAVEELNAEVRGIATTLEVLRDSALGQESGHDPLTRLFNRRYLPAVLKHETGLSIKFTMPYALLLIDIDHFKRINDQYGHTAGDAVLRQFAEILIGEMRPSDYLFRYGGEEFLVCVTEADANEALRIADRIREAVARRRFVLDAEPQLQVTASIGISVHDGHPDYQRTLSAADTALYRAKNRGRNCCVLSADS